MVEQLETSGSADVEVVIKGFEHNPPFYRPIVDDWPARRAEAARRLRAAGLLPAGPSTGESGLVRASVSAAAANALRQSGYVVAITAPGADYVQALNMQGIKDLVRVSPVNAAGYLGGGVRIAVIDNDFDSVSLASVLVQEECFCQAGCCAGGTTRASGVGVSNIPGTVDYHGTEVASEIAFAGSQGAAPQAGIVAIAAEGPADLYAAMDWLALREEIAAVNLSLLTGVAQGVCDTNPLAASWTPRTTTLANQGKIVVAATGNGASRNQIGIPACISNVVAVAGSWACDALTKSGPPGCDSGALTDAFWPVSDISAKVDVLAPARPLEIPYLDPGGPGYASGTSNAAPLVAACAALLRQAHPTATRVQIDNALRQSALAISLPVTGGAVNRPRLDCTAGLNHLGQSAGSGINLNQHGLTGAWYQPATSGQGLAIEVLPDVIQPGTGRMFGGWFTYAPAPAGNLGKQRWFYLDGPAPSSGSSTVLTIYRNTGGKFDAPPITNAVAIGSATISFSSCTSGTLSYTFNAGVAEVANLSGTIPLTRLYPNVSCNGAGFSARFYRSGNWYEAATAGQGFVMEANPVSGSFFATWYTYVRDGQPGGGLAGQRWYSLQYDSYDLNSNDPIVVPIYQTTGGVFDTPTPPGQTTVPVGTATVFLGCQNVLVSYTFTDGENLGLSGSIPATRVGPTPAGCQ